MEPLVFQIQTQADDSGIRKYDKSIGGLDSSAKKASTALNSFSRDLLNARSGADVAAAGAEALSKMLQKSLAGAVVIGGVKIVADQIEQMAQIIRSAGEATGAAVTQLERMGEVKGLEDATRAVGVLDGSLETITKQLGGIREGNWFTKLSDAATGTSKELEKQIITLERLRDSQIALGFATERNNAERTQGFTEEQKQYDAIEQRLKKRLELADRISKESAKATAIQDANAIAEIEKRNLTIKLTEDQGKKEADLAKQREKDAAAQLVAMEKIREAQQKRFNELYDAEIKSQEQTQKRIDAEIKAEEERSAKRAALTADVATAKEEEGKAIAGAVPSIFKFASGGSGARGRETSVERGARVAGERAYTAGRMEASNAEIQRTINVIKEEKKATGDTTFTGLNEARNRLIEIYKSEEKARGMASLGIQGATKSVTRSTTALSDFNASTSKASSRTETFSTNLSDLGTNFDSTMKSANMFSSGLLESSSNMISDFLKTGDSSSSLGDDFDNASQSVEDFSERIKKSGGGGAGMAGGSSQNGLAGIYALLDKNLKEMRTYAFVK
jgi:hypothetical protein